MDIVTKSGDTWNGLYLKYTKNGNPVDLSDAVITMQIRKISDASDYELKFSSEDGTIVITDPVNGLYQIPKIIISLVPRQYFYDIQIVTPEETKTRLEGKFTVTSDITR